MSCSLEYGTVLPTRVIPTTTLMIFVIIVSKFRVKIIVANEKNVTTPTTDIAMSTVNVTFKLRFFVLCPDLYFYFFVALIFFNSLAHNVVVYGPLRVKARNIPSTNLRENSAGIFQISTDPAMVYTRCCQQFLFRKQSFNFCC